MPPTPTMTGPEPNGEPEGLDVRRRRARFRAWHRGTREMDLVMGRFADRELAGLSEGDLVAFEHLLDLSEAEVFGWVTGREVPPAGIDRALIERLRIFPGAP